MKSSKVVLSASAVVSFLTSCRHHHVMKDYKDDDESVVFITSACEPIRCIPTERMDVASEQPRYIMHAGWLRLQSHLMTKLACPEYDNAGQLRIIVVQLLYPLIHSGTTAWCTPRSHACLATTLGYLRYLDVSQAWERGL